MRRNGLMLLVTLLATLNLACGMTSKELAPDDIQKTTLYAATADGLAIGSQGGKKWENIHSSRKKNIVSDTINDFAISDALTIAATPKGILISTSNLQTWSSQDFKGFNSPEINSVLIDDNMIYLATSIGVLTSTNNAKTWTSSKFKGNFKKIVNSSKGLLAISETELWISTSNARSWSKKELNTKQINDIDARENEVVLATSQGILISNNNAKSFDLINESNGLLKNETTAVYIDEQNTLYAGNELGFNISRDLGKSWNKYDRTDGLEMSRINSIYVKANFYFLGTDAGIYASFDKGAKWQKFDRSKGLRSNNISKVFAK